MERERTKNRLGRFLALAVTAVVLRGVGLLADDAETSAPPQPKPFQATTEVALSNGFWTLSGKPTYAGTRAKGLLFNVRMVHALFEDRNDKTRPDGFDADANTARFVASLPKYAAQGVLAFTVNLQGGDPGYEGALNSAFASDGTLRGSYIARAAQIIEACDAAGLVVILGCLSPNQDQHLEDSAAIREAVVGTAAWVHSRGYKNVLLEVADDHLQAGYDHEKLHDPTLVASLIRAAREAAPGLLISASGAPNGRVNHLVAGASDFLLLHFHRVPSEQVFRRSASAAKHVKALVCNADAKTGEAAVSTLESAVQALCSWGYANPKNERHPFRFDGPEDDPEFYGKLRDLTTKGP
jgi:hypothetical protein